jgi:uncharacterized membrane protein
MARLARVTPVAALWAAIASFAVGFSALSVLRHDAFATGRFDLGNMVQAVWSTAHGHPLRVTDLRGAQVLRLGAHVDPVLALFAPLWWIWPSPDLLLVAQGVALALGALPVFLLARKHLRSGRAGVAFALAYLLYPATTWTALNEFHPVALCCSRRSGRSTRIGSGPSRSSPSSRRRPRRRSRSSSPPWESGTRSRADVAAPGR